MITGWDKFDKLNDKLKHFIFGFVIAIGVSFPFSPLIGFVVAGVAGLAKELWDYYDYGKFDRVDLFATAVGGACGIIIYGVF